MESSNQKNKHLFDPIRKKWVEATPEEIIRQNLLREMIGRLGYPPALIAIEKELSHFSEEKNIPQRRLDILVFSSEGGALMPLLMIECKSLPLTSTFARQVIGYNTFVKATFLALANHKQVLMGYFHSHEERYVFKEGLPSYLELTKKINLRRDAQEQFALMHRSQQHAP